MQSENHVRIWKRTIRFITNHMANKFLFVFDYLDDILEPD